MESRKSEHTHHNFTTPLLDHTHLAFVFFIPCHRIAIATASPPRRHRISTASPPHLHRTATAPPQRRHRIATAPPQPSHKHPQIHTTLLRSTIRNHESQKSHIAFLISVIPLLHTTRLVVPPCAKHTQLHKTSFGSQRRITISTTTSAPRPTKLHNTTRGSALRHRQQLHNTDSHTTLLGSQHRPSHISSWFATPTLTHSHTTLLGSQHRLSHNSSWFATPTLTHLFLVRCGASHTVARSHHYINYYISTTTYQCRYITGCTSLHNTTRG